MDAPLTTPDTARTHLSGKQRALRDQPSDRLLLSSRASTGFISDAAIRFSWTQGFISALAYVWLLSNFVRTGSASNLDSYKAIEPSVYVNFGPYAYPVNTFYKDASSGTATADEEIAEWSYKYDTTSIAMRAFAELLSVTEFPDCVLYRGRCRADKISPLTGFTMLDSLVDAVHSSSSNDDDAAQTAKFKTRQDRQQRQPTTVLLKAQYEYLDRIHHYLLSWIFTAPLWRTCQALYYSAELLSSSAAAAAADISNSTRQDTVPADVCSHAYGDIAARLHTIRELYWNATVDMLIVEGSKDLAMHRGGAVFVGKRDFDVVTIFRVRSCVALDACTTTVVDEYRYEGETFATDILDWYPIVATLRGVAQAYYWVRLAALYVGCYNAVVGCKEGVSRDTLAPSFTRNCRTAFVVFFKIPSQVIIYGSLFPLACYLAAHMIDSPMIYELIAQKFDSFNGLFQLSVMELVTVSSIQMRNVWVLASVTHLVVRISTQRSWSPLQGIWSMPQFSIALISSLTIVSQFRFIALRHTPVLRIQPLAHQLSRVHPLLESFLGSTYGGGGRSTPGGVFLDMKAVGCSTVLLVVAAALGSLVLRRVRPHARLVFWRSYSFTPLTAGVLWPTNALAVSWSDDLFQFNRIESSLLRRRVAVAAITPLTLASMPKPSSPLLAMVMNSLDDRIEAAEATLYLLNIAMLTDPLVFLTWWLFRHATLIAVVRSERSQREFFVPLEQMAVLSWDGFTQLRVVPIDELRWADVITCG